MLPVITSCKKDAPLIYDVGTNEYINTWILDSMRRYYFWSENLPADPNLNIEPNGFFETIRNETDRFSRLYLPNDPSSFETSSRSAFGFEYAVIEQPKERSVLGVVKLVLKDSPAERAGLKRGDLIKSINGKAFTTENTNSLYQALINSQTLNLTTQIFVSGETAEQEIEIQKGWTFEQPLVSRIYTLNTGKVGYVYIDHFSFGLSTSLQPVFKQFKNEHINALILDLRYNLGGEVSEAAGVSALIAPDIDFRTAFITYKGNKNGGTRDETFGEAATFDGYIYFDELLHAKLNLPNVYVLTTRSTASAAEVVINCLKPYMEVITIGEKTMGKDLASFLIKDGASPQQVAWEIQPIVYKLYNSAGSGDYGKGLSPTLTVNELDELPLFEIGDDRDLLIKAALNQVQKTNDKVYRTKTSSHAIVRFDSQSSRASQSVILTHK